jgi:hypothetical protein
MAPGLQMVEDSLKKHKFLEQLDLFEATRQGKARQGKQQQ